jgi:hypothetical protein
MIYTRPFIFRAFAEDYLSFPHTIQQKGSAMGGIGKEQKQGVARFQSPVFRRTPTPPTLGKTVFSPHNACNIHNINSMHFSNVNQSVTLNP